MQAEEHRFQSAALGNERSIWIRSPESAPHPLPLLIFLDAEIYRPELDAENALGRLESEGAIPTSLAVFVSNLGPETRFTECPCNPDFALMVLEELLPWLEERYPVAREPSLRTLVGVSYSGLAAAWVAVEGAGRIGSVVSQSGSFWSENGRLIDLIAEREPRPIRFYLEVGREETQDYIEHRPDLVQMESQLLANRRMRDALIRQGYVVDYREVEGSHHPNSWRSTLPDGLRWALQAPAARPDRDADGSPPAERAG